MSAVETVKRLAVRSVRARQAHLASASTVRRFEMVHGRAVRPVVRRSTPDEVTRSGLRLVRGASSEQAVQCGNASGLDPTRNLDRPTWMKVVWVGTVLASAGAIYLVAG